MSKRPRFPEDLFNLLQEKKDSPNDNIGDVLLDEFPELKEELERESSGREDDLLSDESIL